MEGGRGSPLFNSRKAAAPPECLVGRVLNRHLAVKPLSRTTVLWKLTRHDSLDERQIANALDREREVGQDHVFPKKQPAVWVESVNRETRVWRPSVRLGSELLISESSVQVLPPEHRTVSGRTTLPLHEAR